jgi:hypothetical protein
MRTSGIENKTGRINNMNFDVVEREWCENGHKHNPMT